MADPSPAPKPRRSRLQFSLRLLLLAFTAFALGFPIWYRWPFEETEYDYEILPGGEDGDFAFRDLHQHLEANMGRREGATRAHHNGQRARAFQDD